MNVAYIKIGTKKELKKLNVPSSGFLKKSKVNYSNIDVSQFKCIDIRNTKSISLPKKFKIMTNMPTDSYNIVSDEHKGNTLVISNTTRFWSISKILIIQTNE